MMMLKAPPRAMRWRRALGLAVMTLTYLLLPACRENPSCDTGARDTLCPVDAGTRDGGLGHTLQHGTLSHRTTPRESPGGLKLRVAGNRTYVLEIQRDPAYRESRRLVAYAAPDRVLWQVVAQPRELFTDFTVHPSGEVSLGVERTGDARNTYDIVRLTVDGRVRSRQPLPPAATLPVTDLGGVLPNPPFLMKAEQAGAYIEKWLPWLRLEARGEDLVVAFLSFVARPDGGSSISELASGVMALQWSEESYTEQWTRIVDGTHSLLQVAWQYDEFHWRDAATQLLLDVRPDGRVTVGRTLSLSRCFAVSQTFQEVGRTSCRIISSYNSSHRYQPFAFTAFSPMGAREGTHVLAPQPMEEFVIFDMAVRGDEVGVVGTAVVLQEDGGTALYPSMPDAEIIMQPYDGYVAVLDRRTGTPRQQTLVDEGRGEYFAALRWTEDGLLAAGATDWDRWSGGMSISRGALPLLALVPEDGGSVQTRHLGFDDRQRHFHLLSVDTDGSAIMSSGLSEAPMTHTGDTAGTEVMTFGGLTVEVR
ncbi:hypothetical protein P2318_24935 [Myxococcaceae bacterium GXIMD 01537]